MRIIDSEAERPDNAGRGVAMGFFDGMHRGHQQVVRTLAHLSAERGLRSCVYTFHAHPSTIIAGRDNPEGYLCDAHERLQLIGASGADEIYLQHFDRRIADMTEDEFLGEILVKTLNARLVVIGYDFRFGKGRSGDADTLRKWAVGHGIEIVVVEAFSMSGTVASSTAIRRMVAQGRMEEASAFLGRDYKLTGIIAPGRRLGSRLGFPTANITITAGRVAPASGVYATRTCLDGVVYESITNIGTRPTIDRQDARLVVETFLLDTSGDFYGKLIEVEFLSKIRDEIRFNSLLQLSAQIGNDIDVVRAWHRDSERLWKCADVNGIPVYLLRSARFRTSILALTFRVPISPRNATVYNLLLRILSSCCRRIPARRNVSVELDRLYGSRIDASTDKEGDNLCLHFMTDAVTTWIDGTRIFDEAGRLLMDMLTDPLLDEDGCFPAAVVETERTNYENELASRWNDREKYAYDQGVSWYLYGRPHGVDTDGYPDLLRTVTRKELTEAYTEMIAKASLTVVAGGDLGPVERGWLLERLSRFPSGQRQHPPIPGKSPSPCRMPEGCREKIESRPMEQARILAVLTGLPPYFSAESMAINVLNSMLGADTHSLLFEHVRERLGLAYSVFTSVLRFVRGIAVYAGVAPSSVDVALKTVMEQVDSLAQGYPDEKVFRHSVTMLRNQLLTLSDSLSSLLGFYSSGLSNGRLFLVSDALRLLEDVTPDRVRTLAADLRLSSVYIVMPETPGEDLT